ncbi:MAG: CRTAC1 family protein [Planctomycetaceae bacterium]|nr:CRTAC1 family protein [Planctomycetaceae bacterium]
MLSRAASAFLLMAMSCHRSTSRDPSSEHEKHSVDSQKEIRQPVHTHIRFSDKTAQSSLEFTYQNGQEAGHYSILESLGGGLALIDFECDGREDLLFAGGGGYTPENGIVGRACGMFRNLGDWKYEDVSKRAAVTASDFYNHGITRGDFDNDGFADLFVTGYGGGQLLKNLGDGTFEDVTADAKLQDREWSSSAAWGDFNNDGALDLYVVHYVDWSFDNHPFCPAGVAGKQEVCPPRTFSGVTDSVYFANGLGGFEKKPEAMTTPPMGKGLSVLTSDLDKDGDTDIYVTNDTVPNHLYQNDGAGLFKDHSLMSGTSLNARGIPDGSMGVSLLDYNRDGEIDLWVVNYENETAALYRNEGQLMFRHVSSPTGVTDVGGLFVGWGTCCADFDRDGDEDIFVSNGHVIRFPKNAPLRQHPLLFENLGTGHFENIAPTVEGYLSRPHMGRGVASGDFDGDGDWDLAISHLNEPATLLSNETPARGSWIAIRLIGRKNSRDAIGSVVGLTTDDGPLVRHRSGGGSYASSDSPNMFFGLKDGTELREATIRWPGGHIQNILGEVRLNEVVTIVEELDPR